MKNLEMSLFLNLQLPLPDFKHLSVPQIKLIDQLRPDYKNNHMKNISRMRRLICSSMMIGFLLTVGFTQTPLTAGVPYDIDFNTEAFDLSGGNATCNGQAFTFGPTGAGWEITNAEGATCGTPNDCGSYTSGNNDAQFETILFDIRCVSDVEIEVFYDLSDDMQDEEDCSTGPNGCGNDNLIFYYELNGAGLTQFGNPSLCAAGSGSILSGPLNGSTLKVVVEGGTQADDETITIENIILNAASGTPPANDECATAIPLVPGDLYTNDCATADDPFTCGTPQEEATVWFTYTVPAGLSSVTLTLNPDGTAISDPAWAVFDACGNAPILDGEKCDGTDITIIDCGSESTFVIQVGSELANVGEFNITETTTPIFDPTAIVFAIDEMGLNNNSDDFEVCEGDDFDLSATHADDDGSWTYDWEDLNGGTYLASNPVDIDGATIVDHSGMWMVTVTDNNGCSQVGDVTITVNPLPLPADPAVDAACENGELTLSFGGTETIIDWEDPSGSLLGSTSNPITITSNAVAGTDDGTYWVIVSDGNGCSNSSMVDVSLNPAPNVAIDDSAFPVCPGVDVLIGETGGDADMWEWVSDMTGSFDDEFIQNPTVSGLIDGETITVQVTDINGCTASSSVTVSLNPPPSNDDCSSPDPIASSGLTNECSTEDVPLGSCGAPQQEATVWYTYNVAAPVSSLTLTLTPGTITGAGWAVYDACGGNLLGEDCAGGDIILDCVLDGDILIQVGSDPTTTGDFGIDVSETSAVANDLCDDPISATPTAVCTEESFSGTTTGACPENWTGGSCGQENFPTIWFEFTADATATSVSFTNVNGSFQIIDFDCPAQTGVAGCITGDMTIPVTGSTQYFITGTDDASAGTVSFNLTMNAAPANDLCVDAIVASAGTTSGDNSCASTDASLCSDNDHVVYYSYTTIEENATITITSSSDVVLDAWLACDGTQYDASVSCGASLTYFCVPIGTDLIIPVGSATGNEGPFDFEIMETAGTVANDDCSSAEEVTVLLPCTSESVSGDTSDACPEGFTAGCTQDTDPTIWYTFTTLSGTTSIDFTNVNGAFELFTECPVVTSISGCIDADQGVTVSPGTTYWMSATMPGGEGAVSVDIAFLEAPTNDDCGAAEDASSGTASGTTGCASADANFCGASTDHVVYYSYTVAGPGSVTVQIDVAAGDATDIAIEAWSACDGTDFDASLDCAASLTLNCVPPGTVLIIPVGSADGGEGTFDLTITETAGSVANDDCSGAEEVTVLLPCTPESVSGDTSDACPEGFTAGCTQDTDPTIWYTFTTLSGTTSIDFTNVNGAFELFTECPVVTSVSGCIDADQGVTVSPGTTYWMSATMPGGEGAVSVDIAFLEAPSNDVCTSAEDASGGTASGTTGCASADANFCGASTDHVVYYSYTVAGPGSVTVQIDVAAGDATDIAIEAWSACDGTDFDASLDCAASLTLNCVPPGTVLIIPVGSADGGEGTFDLTITETAGAVANDDCSGAEEVTVLLPCTPESVSGDTSDACPEGFTAGCTQDTDPTIWYTFTTLSGTTSIDFTNVNGAFELFTECPVVTSVSGCIDADQGVTVSPGTTYWMSATMPGGEGAVSVDIAFLEAPSNDVCISAEDASGGTASGTTGCASADANFCGASTDHVVYYSYTVAGPGSVTVQIDVAAGDATDIAIEAWAACDGTDFDASLDCAASLTLNCVPPGTVLIIPVGSADGGEGTFDLTITETPGSVANDDCTGAEEIVVALPCTAVDFSGDTTDACPEGFTAGCTQDTDPTIWYTFTTLAGTSSIDFTNVNGTFEIFTECPVATSISGCVDADQGVPVSPSTTYWMSATLAGGEGAVSGSIAFLEAPANDDCGAAEDASGGTASGTTGCASADANFCGASSDHVV